jgi:DNA-binding IscR family transcriptional regulator
MVQGKFLKSEQGAYGGYLIMRDLTKVSLRELIEKVVGPIEMVKCMGDSEKTETPCEIKEKCNIMLPLISLNDKLVRFYENINVHDLISTARKTPEVQAAAPETEAVTV